MFAFAKAYLEQRAYRRLNVLPLELQQPRAEPVQYTGPLRFVHVPLRQRRRRQRRRLFNDASPGHAPYEMFVEAGQKALYGAHEAVAAAADCRCVQNQLEMCYMDLNKIYAFDDKLKDLEWLYKLWETRGLVNI